jgi:hypothetical protein
LCSKGFYTVTESRSLEEGAKSCLTLSGLGKLAPNMILMGFKVPIRIQGKKGSDPGSGSVTIL